MNKGFTQNKTASSRVFLFYIWLWKNQQKSKTDF